MFLYLLFSFWSSFAADMEIQIQGKLPEKSVESYSGQEGTPVLQGLDGLSGIKTTSGGINSVVTSFTLRGLSSAHYLLLVDGIPMINQGATEGSAPLFSLIDPHSIESIEILKGSYTAEYGPRAQAGVIKVTTKKGTFQNFGVEYTSYRAQNLRYTYQNKTQKISLLWDQGKSPTKSSYEKLVGNLGHQWSYKNTDFHLQGEYLRHHTQGIFPYPLEKDKNASVEHHLYQFHGGFKSYFLEEILSLSVDTTYQNTKMLSFYPSGNRFLDPYQQTTLQSWVEYRPNNTTHTQIGFNNSVGDRFQWKQWLEYGLGDLDFSLDSQKNFQLIPSLALSPEKEHKIFYKIGRGKKAPSDYQKYGIYGQRFLESEELRNQELGYKVTSSSTGNWDAQVSYFYHQFSNKIDYDFVSSKYKNTNRVITQGVDFSWNTPQMSVNYSYQKRSLFRWTGNFFLQERIKFSPSIHTAGDKTLGDVTVGIHLAAPTPALHQDYLYISIQNILNTPHRLSPYTQGLGRYFLTGYKRNF